MNKIEKSNFAKKLGNFLYYLINNPSIKISNNLKKKLMQKMIGMKRGRGYLFNIIPLEGDIEHKEIELTIDNDDDRRYDIVRFSIFTFLKLTSGLTYAEEQPVFRNQKLVSESTLMIEEGGYFDPSYDYYVDVKKINDSFEKLVSNLTNLKLSNHLPNTEINKDSLYDAFSKSLDEMEISAESKSQILDSFSDSLEEKFENLSNISKNEAEEIVDQFVKENGKKFKKRKID
jgi:hypothetical protein